MFVGLNSYFLYTDWLTDFGDMHFIHNILHVWQVIQGDG